MPGNTTLTSVLQGKTQSGTQVKVDIPGMPGRSFQFTAYSLQ